MNYYSVNVQIIADFESCIINVVECCGKVAWGGIHKRDQAKLTQKSAQLNTKIGSS